MARGHSFLRFILPGRAFGAVRCGTKEWLAECPCGHRFDLWDRGGIRYRAVGEPLRLIRCEACGESTMHRIRKKTPAEKQEFP